MSLVVRPRGTPDSTVRMITLCRLAGSDTTAASFKALFYYLCRNSRAYHRLAEEIDLADSQGKLTDPVTFTEAQDLPYLQAVIKETLRMYMLVLN